MVPGRLVWRWDSLTLENDVLTQETNSAGPPGLDSVSSF